MKKSSLLLRICSLGIIGVSLLSCSSNGYVYVPYNEYVTPFDNYEEVTGNGYYKPKEYKSIVYKNDKNEDETLLDFNDVYRDKDNTINLSSIGKQKLLVIPVDFKDYACSLLSSGCDNALINIENAFFGSESQNKWESVASFYNKASYGKFQLTGKVSPWFTYSKNAADIQKSTRNILVNNVRGEALAWYQSQFDDISDYYIDGKEENGVALYLIYSHPYAKGDGASNNVFWAYTVVNPDVTSWSSIELINNNDGKVDSHTYIHEFGHILGLNDYYNTTSSGVYNPTGRLDMMDYTIGDHSGYSKMLLNWTRPYVITSPTTLTISPFTSSGDLILLKSNWNGSAMDEYLLLEFYSPQGLNYRDDRHYVSQPSLKVYHVDSRVGFSKKQINIINYGYINDTKLSRNNYYMRIMNDNSDYTYLNNRLYHLLESSGQNTFMNGGYVDNQTLFNVGDDFGVNTFQNYTFHDGSTVPFKFKVDNITNTQITISFFN